MGILEDGDEAGGKKMEVKAPTSVSLLLPSSFWLFLAFSATCCLLVPST